MTSKTFDTELKMNDWTYNPHNFRMSVRISEKSYLSAFYNEKTNQYSLRGISKYNSPLGGSSIGIKWDFNSLAEFWNKIKYYETN